MLRIRRVPPSDVRGACGASALPWLAFVLCVLLSEQTLNAEPRREFRLDDGWRSIVAAPGRVMDDTNAQPAFDDHAWKPVDVPHNWDGYDGFRQARHGNLHGTAWYRRTFALAPGDVAGDRRVFLFFEGVGSYATVWVNGVRVGAHAGGLTTFTLDVTAAVRTDAPNLLAVRADHPAGIRDLPWVCGGCEQAYGFSEGSQPFGIFRPVHVVITAPVRIAPFGVQVWNDAPVDTNAAVLHVRTDVTNHGDAPRTFALETRVLDARGEVVAEAAAPVTLPPGSSITVAQELSLRAAARLWSPGDPYRYTLQTDVRTPSAVLDRVETPYGIRWIEWPAPHGAPGQPFRVNGRPVFLNGVADYEHLLGASHAFTDAQARARVRQVEAAGFNAFRDAHHPHNLQFNEQWDHGGVLWWTQFGAHIWFENDAFQANFKSLLRDWVRERRNSPSLVLWGLQNESKLPAAFAAECAAIIRELDPTASSQRLITTCNGGEGTDWNVPQNWTGTYGGDPLAYAEDLRRQRLVGEYGAWRSLGLHEEVGRSFDPPSPPAQSGSETRPTSILSEDRMVALLETKVRLAETVRDQVAGHFLWPLTTHANPGRNFGENGEQLFEGIREVDRLGPANNKGLFTIWGEPTDAYHMFRANYAPATTQPMVYIVSHTWPDRWTAPGRKSGIIAYSNCDEVELFNDVGARSLGLRRRGATGTHFTWDDVPIATNVLYAEGRIGGRTVATDITLLHHLPEAPEYARQNAAEPALASLAGERAYLYRVNCGGPEYLDASGNTWLADREWVDVAPRGSAGTLGEGAAVPGLPGRATEHAAWGCVSWAHHYPHLSPALGSQRKITDPIAGTRDDPLFQTFRYGREELHYLFPAPDGVYDIELYFIEPWYLPGGGTDCTGWRVFDVAVNGETRLHDVDLWREAGRAHAIRKTVTAQARNGLLEISFPRVRAGQAVISALAISTTPSVPAPAGSAADGDLTSNLRVGDPANVHDFAARTHLDHGDSTYGDASVTFCAIPWSLLGADWIRTARASAVFSGEELLRFTVGAPCDIFIAHDARIAAKPRWLATWDHADGKLGTTENSAPGFELFRRRFAAGDLVILGANRDTPASEDRMYAVIAKPVRPSAPPAIIRDLTVSDAPGWRASGNLQAGLMPYADRTTVFTTIPPALSDADWIRTAQTAANDVRASFTTAEHVEVYVSLDARATARPAWMHDWIETNLALTTSDPIAHRFLLWKHRLAPGATIALGPNALLPDGSGAAMYSVIARGVRPSATYPAPRASASGTVVEWTIAVGVGDRYGLNFRYTSSATGAVPVEMAVVNPDGSVFCTRPLGFAPGSGAAQILRTRTCESINAGTYRIRLTGPKIPAVQFGELEVE